MTSLGLLLAPALALAATGLSTRMPDVRVEGLVPGRGYDLAARGTTYTVFNRSDRRVEVAIEPVSPDAKTLLPGYEAAPADWAALSPARQGADPGAALSTSITLRLPDDPALLGRKFQLNLWSHTAGGTLGVGVLSRLRLETAPAEVRLSTASFSGGEGELTATNLTDRPLKLELSAAVKLKPSKLRLAPGQTVRVLLRAKGGPARFEVTAREDGRPAGGVWIEEARR